MQQLAYVFITDEGWYFGDRVSARIKKGQKNACFFQPFKQAKLFSSAGAAKAYRSGIINTDISDKMILMSIGLAHTKQDIFKAILKKD